MVCDDHAPTAQDLHRYAEENRTRDTAQYYRERNDELARMLCALCETIKTLGFDWTFTTVPGLQKWWDNHQKLDREKGR